ncbi:PAS domain-containing sensor histidine kinase [Fibrella aquatilis]|uniref:histidine kinase n=1 Tax=Fibrella aquatilis TaxID=2817059 RepID=A0A939GD80_9BACT|nr:ATP-binding protein [Fibrella aquatilis]MBO0934695.1 PAS domain-containing protein [Fibrella aquatilis]
MPANTSTQPPVVMLQSVLNASQNGVAVYQAVRAANGHLTDLRVTILNAVAERDMGRPAVEVVGKLFSAGFPEMVSTDLYSRFCRVIETGQSDQFEFSLMHPVRHQQEWYDVSAVRMEDSVVVSFDNITAQKAAERTIQQQAELLQGLMGNTPVGMAIFETVRRSNSTVADFRFVLVNPVLEGIMCIPAQQVVGQLVSRLFPAANESGFMSRAITGVELGISQVFEMPYTIKNTPGWYRLSMAPQGDRLIAAIIDITESKRAQLDHHHQAELLRSVLDGSQNAVVAFDAIRNVDGTITDFRYILQNEANRQRVKRTDEQVIGNTMLTYFPNVLTNGLFNQYVQVVESGQPMRTEIAFDYGLGAGWYDLSVVKRADGIILTVQDKTREKQAEQALTEQAGLLKAVVDNSPTGIVLYKAVRDEHQQVTDFSHVLSNPANAAITGLNERELVDKLVARDYPASVESGHYATLLRVLETGEPESNLFHYDAHGINGWFDGGYVRQGDGVLFTYSNITDLKLAQQRLEYQNVELLRSNDNLQQFAYVASHDLQEPLRKIQSFGDMLIKEFGDNLPINGQDMVHRMQGAANRMSLLIRDLLAYSRIGIQREPFQPLVLSELIGQVLEDLDVAIQESKAVIYCSELPTVPGNRLLLHQLFQNLLGNAIKFRQPGLPPHISITSRRLTTAQLPDGVVPASLLLTTNPAERPAAYHEICVSDQGIGFDEKYLDRIFQVFQRLHGKSSFAGSGVGLAICKKVVEHHGGAIAASSQPNAGATFRVYLPV